jgi:hypothetical protein
MSKKDDTDHGAEYFRLIMRETEETIGGYSYDMLDMATEDLKTAMRENPELRPALYTLTHDPELVKTVSIHLTDAGEGLKAMRKKRGKK